MFKKEREFNIISGQKTPFVSERSMSCAEQRQTFVKQEPINLKPLKLGTAKDRKEFQYGYKNEKSEPVPHALTEQASTNNLQPTMVNYTKTGYNIITHKIPFSTATIASSDMFNHVNLF